MLARVLLCLLLLPSCKILSALKGASLQIKAVIEGEIQGHQIRCEKTIDLADGQWGVMCSVNNGVDVKYRVKSVKDDIAHLEFVVDKKISPGKQKLIAAPSLLVKRDRAAKNVTTTKSSNIVIMAERMR